MREHRRGSGDSGQPRPGSRRPVALEAALRLCVGGFALALTCTCSNTRGSQLVLAAAEVEPVRAATVRALGQPGAIPTSVPDLPSLRAEPVAIALALDAALNAGDVEAVMELFDDAAQVKVPPDVYTGSSQIRNWASYLAANHFGSEPGLRHVSRDTITWPAEVRSDQLARFGLGSLHGEATLIVSGGKIAAYTFVLNRESAGQLRAAQIAASDVLQDPLVVGADFANVYGPEDVFRGADGTLVTYRDLVGAEPGSGPFFDLGGEPVVLRTGL
jgi:hypothetical protein